MISQQTPELTDQMLNNILDLEYVRQHLEIRLIPGGQLDNYRKHNRCFL